MGELRSRCEMAAFLLAVTLAALAPLWDKAGTASAVGAGFPGWPLDYDGRPLTQMPLTGREAAFAQDFPGRVGRFSDGKREIIIRWVGAPTRRLHPAADCFRAIGFSIEPLPTRSDGRGAAMACFRASRKHETMAVCELIRDEQGQSWPDVSGWYWHALLGWSVAPWWSFVVAE